MKRQTEPNNAFRWRTVQRGVFRSVDNNASANVLYSGPVGDTSNRTRRTLTISAGNTFDGCTYFNAFPASYWQHWGGVKVVTLAVEVSARATITIWQSDSEGHQTKAYETTAMSLHRELPLTQFDAGGMYWVSIAAPREHDVTIESIDWSLPPTVEPQGTLSIGITTYNRPIDCVKQLNAIAGESGLVTRLDTLYVVDQGTDLVSEQPDFVAAAEILGNKLRVIRQANLGGSGGFSRAMYETLQAGESDYVLLLDDDAKSEPESILRAINLADYASAAGAPVLVGGAMFHLDNRSTMFVQGETINFNEGRPATLPGVGYNNDFASTPLLDNSKLHARHDALYNGWWMTLIPTDVIRELGLGLPYFLKWDDMEFGLRAATNGIPTVSMPGIAVWHQAWHNKFSWKSWEEYFAERNMWLTMLAYEDKPRQVPLRSFLVDIGMLLSLQYSSVALRIAARDAARSGFSELPEILGTQLAKVRAMRSTFIDARLISDDELPPVEPIRERRVPQKSGQLEIAGIRDYLIAARAAFHQLVTPERPTSRQTAEAVIPAHDALWWRFMKLDSALVEPVEPGGKYIILQRDRTLARKLLLESWRSTRAIHRTWKKLHKQFSRQHDTAASVATWKRLFDAQ